jgi:hypothetical protein
MLSIRFPPPGCNLWSFQVYLVLGWGSLLQQNIPWALPSWSPFLELCWDGEGVLFFTCSMALACVGSSLRLWLRPSSEARPVLPVSSQWTSAQTLLWFPKHWKMLDFLILRVLLPWFPSLHWDWMLGRKENLACACMLCSLQNPWLVGLQISSILTPELIVFLSLSAFFVTSLLLLSGMTLLPRPLVEGFSVFCCSAL